MRALFIRVLEADDKGDQIRAAITCGGSREVATRFDVHTAMFEAIPLCPFAYWIPRSLLAVFNSARRYETANRMAVNGASTCDDARYVRSWFETRQPSDGRQGPIRWIGYARGGKSARFYRDVSAVVRWDGTRTSFHGFIGRPGRWNPNPVSSEYYRQPALTWPLRGSVFTAAALPADCAFSVGGKVALASIDDLAWCLAIFNSRVFHYAMSLYAGNIVGFQFESGIINNAPMPEINSRDSALAAGWARRGWSLKRSQDTRIETSHAFLLPSLLQVTGMSVRDRAEAWEVRVSEVETELARIQSDIDERCFELYGISNDDRRSITEGFGSSSSTAEETELEHVDVDEEDKEEDESESQDEASSDLTALTTELFSWAIGVAMGRFDIRLATGHRAAPSEPEPFDPLPACSPGMLAGDDGLPLTKPPADYPVVFFDDGVLVDDPGHARDIIEAVRQVFYPVFGEQSDVRWREACEILDPGGHELRSWLSRSFFESHIKQYSKSRRKAPIYWQFGVPSGRYSVWLYAHRISKDRLFQVLKDLLQPKLNQEEGVLGRLKQEASGSATQSQRKAIESHEDFIAEIKMLIDDVAYVAPMWAPDLDDGVVICLAPLWRLFPQNKSWQKECKRVWDKLVEGDYDWAHMAMHLWPERVVPKCQTDRSLAIAHGLEDIFWEQKKDEKWVKRKPPEENGNADWQPTIDRLVAERTSRQVKDALASLLAAPVAEGGKRGRRAAAAAADSHAAAGSSTKRKGKSTKARDESEELF